MRIIFVILMGYLVTSCASLPKKLSPEEEIINFQKNLNESYLNPEESPLRGKYFTQFKAHPFFPINLKYRVNATYEPIENSIPFQMPTSSGKTQTYLSYALIKFELDGKSHQLVVYQNQRLKDMPEYKNHLFLPFYDLTNDVETYAGGRYLDLEMPKSNKIIIDFNQAYQPYCAYNIYDYSCPIVPSENRLDIRIPAGVKYNAEEFEHD
ncbi:MAG: DUF1684 domain-containing protein [Flavobacteriaceae bacterium]|nr:DUF1684 domain-containing protein [Flavobacteriaceae bacterium]